VFGVAVKPPHQTPRFSSAGLPECLYFILLFLLGFDCAMRCLSGLKPDIYDQSLTSIYLQKQLTFPLQGQHNFSIMGGFT
jgi:hypothetical protein